MSSWIEKLPPEVVKLAADAAEALARGAWHAFRGESTDDDEAAIKAIARRGLLAQVGAAEREAQALRDGIELGMALERLFAAMGEVPAAMSDAERRGRERMDFPTERVQLTTVDGKETP